MWSVFYMCIVLIIVYCIEIIIDCDWVLVLVKGGWFVEFDIFVNFLRCVELIIRDGLEGCGVGNYGFVVMVV